jgi:hypothetical protein
VQHDRGSLFALRTVHHISVQPVASRSYAAYGFEVFEQGGETLVCPPSDGTGQDRDLWHDIERFRERD